MVNRSYDSLMFGDNFSVANLTVMPARHILNYNLTREDQVKGIIKFVNTNGNDNHSDIVTKSCASNTWFAPMKHLLFWHEMEFIKERVVANGSENMLSTPPLSQAKGTPQQSFKIDLRHILGD